MQNKPNFKKAQKSTSLYGQKDCEKMTVLSVPQKKTKQTQSFDPASNFLEASAGKQDEIKPILAA